MNWDELGFNLVPADYMYVMKCSLEKGFTFTQGNITPYGNIEMSPFSGILNYGQVRAISFTQQKYNVQLYHLVGIQSYEQSTYITNFITCRGGSL
jgi:hypothetical protein